MSYMSKKKKYSQHTDVMIAEVSEQLKHYNGQQVDQSHACAAQKSECYHQPCGIQYNPWLKRSVQKIIQINHIIWVKSFLNKHKISNMLFFSNTKDFKKDHKVKRVNNRYLFVTLTDSPTVRQNNFIWTVMVTWISGSIVLPISKF